MPDQITRLLDQIDRLDQKSTPGKWVANEGTLKNREGWSIFVDEHNNTVTSATPGDAEFIAHARESLPQLAKALQAVMELHKTRVHDEDPTSPFCNFCGPGTPCETTQAITDVLEATSVV